MTNDPVTCENEDSPREIVEAAVIEWDYDGKEGVGPLFDRNGWARLTVRLSIYGLMRRAVIVIDTDAEEVLQIGRMLQCSLGAFIFSDELSDVFETVVTEELEKDWSNLMNRLRRARAVKAAEEL